MRPGTYGAHGRRARDDMQARPVPPGTTRPEDEEWISQCPPAPAVPATPPIPTSSSTSAVSRGPTRSRDARHAAGRRVAARARPLPGMRPVPAPRRLAARGGPRGGRDVDHVGDDGRPRRRRCSTSSTRPACCARARVSSTSPATAATSRRCCGDRGIEPTVYEAVDWRAAALRADGHRVIEAGPEDEAAATHHRHGRPPHRRLPPGPPARLDAGVAAYAWLLAPAGTAVIEFDHAASTIGEVQFDAVRHGHFRYLTLAALVPGPRPARPRRDARDPPAGVRARCASRSGRRERRPTRRPPRTDRSTRSCAANGRRGSRTRPSSRGSRGRVADLCAALRGHLDRRPPASGPSPATGPRPAPSPCSTPPASPCDELPYTVDRSPSKHGRYLPGTGIPIRDPGALVDAPPDDLLVLTWDLADEVVAAAARARGAHAVRRRRSRALADVGPARVG